MNLTAAQTSALWPLVLPALAGCVLPILTLDKDQATAKWIRGVMYAVALAALGASFLYLTNLWKVTAEVNSLPVFFQLRMDRLAQFAGIFITVAGGITILQMWDHLHHEGWVKGETLSLLLFSCVGMMVFASTTNLLVLFLGLELLSLPLYALTSTVRMREASIEGGLKYFITGAVAASCFLMGMALVYGLTGSLDLRALTLSDPLMTVAVVLLLSGFLFKISAVPFHQWTPDAYEASPHPIAGFMSVATKGAAVIALLRVFPGMLMVSGLLTAKLTAALALIAGATLVVGNLSALVQSNVKRMLAYSSISHAGYLLLGFVAGTPAAYSAVLFYLVVYLAMNLGAFGLLSAYGLVGEKTTFEDLRGLGWKRPVLGVAAVVCFLGLAGIPPTGGFYGKFMIFKELIAAGHVKLAILGVLASLASVYYYLRVLVALFLTAPSAAAEREAEERPEAHAPLASASVWVCALIVMAGGFYQGFLMKGFALRALEESLPHLR